MFEERPISFVSHGAAGRQHVFCPSNHGRTWTGSFDCSVSGREVAERRRLAIQNLAWPMYDVRYDVDIRMYSTDKICKQTSLSISSTCNKRIPTKIGPNAPQNRNRPGAMGVKFKLLPVNLGVRTMLRFSSRTESQNFRSGHPVRRFGSNRAANFEEFRFHPEVLQLSQFVNIRRLLPREVIVTFAREPVAPGEPGTDGSKASYMGDLSGQILS